MFCNTVQFNITQRLANNRSSTELTLGVKLGHGAFCEVREIVAITLKRSPNAVDPYEKEEVFQSKNTDSNIECVFGDKTQIREYMSSNCLRSDDDDESGIARYALKQLKPNNDKKMLQQGLIDLSIEAQFLAYLQHPNIIKMRAIVGRPLSPDFGLVLDRLYMTLEDKMDFWQDEKKAASKTGMCGCLGMGSMSQMTQQTIMFQAITVAYDLSCAMRHIHSQKLVYRDTKPENAGFDVRGDIKLFDFGFAKELTKKLYDKPSGLYNLTPMTGSYPYMAPEVFAGKPYGCSSDVFSFGVLVWEMLHYKFAFYYLSKKDYGDVVVRNNYRPPINPSLPTVVRTVIKESLDPDPKRRPAFHRISVLLRTEYQDFADDSDMLDRSKKMLDKSARSFRLNRRVK